MNVTHVFIIVAVVVVDYFSVGNSSISSLGCYQLRHIFHNKSLDNGHSSKRRTSTNSDQVIRYDLFYSCMFILLQTSSLHIF